MQIIIEMFLLQFIRFCNRKISRYDGKTRDSIYLTFSNWKISETMAFCIAAGSKDSLLSQEIAVVLINMFSKTSLLTVSCKSRKRLLGTCTHKIWIFLFFGREYIAKVSAQATFPASKFILQWLENINLNLFNELMDHVKHLIL